MNKKEAGPIDRKGINKEDILDRAIEHAVGPRHEDSEEHLEQKNCWRCDVWQSLDSLRSELAAAKRVAGELAVELMDREEEDAQDDTLSP